MTCQKKLENVRMIYLYDGMQMNYTHIYVNMHKLLKQNSDFKIQYDTRREHYANLKNPYKTAFCIVCDFVYLFVCVYRSKDRFENVILLRGWERE